jgi:hypothetical protein
VSKKSLIDLDITKVDFKNKHRETPVDPVLFNAMRANISKVGLRYRPEVKMVGDQFVPISGTTRLLCWLANYNQVRGIVDKDNLIPPADIDPDKYEKWSVVKADLLEDVSDLDSLLLTMAENVLRSDLNLMDVSKVLIQMKKEYEKIYPGSKTVTSAPKTGAFESS